MIIINSPNLNSKEFSPRKTQEIKIFSFDQENILKELEELKDVIQEENLEDGEEGKEKINGSQLNEDKEVSDGSDSEPSLDNFENDQLVKLLPSCPKKKSI